MQSYTKDGCLLLTYKEVDITVANGTAVQLCGANSATTGAVVISGGALTNTGNIAIFTSTTALPLGVGDVVVITGMSDANFNGTFPINIQPQFVSQTTNFLPAENTVFTYQMPGVPASGAGTPVVSTLKVRTALVLAPSTNALAVTFGPNVTATTRSLSPGQEYVIPQLLENYGQPGRFDLANWWCIGGNTSDKLVILFASILFMLFFLTGAEAQPAGGGYSPYPASPYSQSLLTNVNQAGWTNALGIGGGGSGSGTLALNNSAFFGGIGNTNVATGLPTPSFAGQLLTTYTSGAGPNAGQLFESMDGSTWKRDFQLGRVSIYNNTASSSESLLAVSQVGLGADNVITMLNYDTGHFSAVRWLSAQEQERGAVGYGNTNTPIYRNVNYFEDFNNSSGFYFVSASAVNGGLERSTGHFAWYAGNGTTDTNSTKVFDLNQSGTVLANGNITSLGKMACSNATAYTTGISLDISGNKAYGLNHSVASSGVEETEIGAAGQPVITIFNPAGNTGGFIQGSGVTIGDFPTNQSTLAGLAKLTIQGNISTAVTTYTTSQVLATANGNSDSTNSTILLNGSALILTLPDASFHAKGRQYTIKLIASGTTATITNFNGSQTIEGALNYLLNNQNEFITVQSDGTNWRVIAAGNANTGIVSAAGITSSVNGVGINLSQNSAIAFSGTLDVTNAARFRAGVITTSTTIGTVNTTRFTNAQSVDVVVNFNITTGTYTNILASGTPYYTNTVSLSGSETIMLAPNDVINSSATMTGAWRVFP